MHILFVIHGKKKRASQVRNSVHPFIKTSDTSEYVETERKGHASDIVEQHFTKADVIVAIGGDGLFHECVIGYMHAKNMNSQSSLHRVLVPWPCGSGNDFARNFNWKNNAQEVMKRVYAEKSTAIDVGKIQFPKGNYSFFLNELSLGLGPEVVRLVNTYPEKWPGKIKFGLGVLRAFRSYEKRWIHLSWNTKQEYDKKALACVIANGKFFGSGIGIAPQADLSDGVFNLTIIGNVTVKDYLMQLRTLFKCKPVMHPEVFYNESKEIRILSRCLMEADGELIGESPAVIGIEKKALLVR